MSHPCKILAAPDPNADQEDVLYDVRHMKLYLDVGTGQIKTRLFCSSCGEKLDCWCYDSLKLAIAAQEERETMTCYPCLLKEGFTEDDIDNMDWPMGDECEIQGAEE